jgi:hypothetical protein
MLKLSNQPQFLWRRPLACPTQCKRGRLHHSMRMINLFPHKSLIANAEATVELGSECFRVRAFTA